MQVTQFISQTISRTWETPNPLAIFRAHVGDYEDTPGTQSKKSIRSPYIIENTTTIKRAEHALLMQGTQFISQTISRTWETPNPLAIFRARAGDYEDTPGTQSKKSIRSPYIIENTTTIKKAEHALLMQVTQLRRQRRVSDLPTLLRTRQLSKELNMPF